MTEPALTLVRYDLQGQDPYIHLAEEELLARTCPPDTVRLVFSRNAPAVILGRNQNPWVEADVRALEHLGVALARRSSGGGTVFHDPGNLNYGFAMPRHLYDPGRFLGIVVQALASLGVPASACPRHSVWAQDRKIAGTAFLLTGRTALLHGCILIGTDLALLRRVLRPAATDLESHAVASVRSPVTRLRDLQAKATPEAVREAIASHASHCLGVSYRSCTAAEWIPREDLARTAEMLRSWEWICGRTPEFRHRLNTSSGAVSLHVKGARIVGVQTEAAGAAAAAALNLAWEGLPYDGTILAGALGNAVGLEAALRLAVGEAVRGAVPPVVLPAGSVLPC